MDDMEQSRACPACSTMAEPLAAFCSQCGSRLTTAVVSPSGRAKWYYNAWFVLAMLFLVAGPFGLPLVWKHPRFSRGVKTMLTIATAMYTLLLIKTTIVMVQAVAKEVSQFNAILQR